MHNPDLGVELAHSPRRSPASLYDLGMRALRGEHSALLELKQCAEGGNTLALQLVTEPEPAEMKAGREVAELLHERLGRCFYALAQRYWSGCDEWLAQTKAPHAGWPKDRAEAARWLERLLESPDPEIAPAVRYDCSWSLARMAFYGEGIAQNETNARALLARARAIEDSSETYFYSETPWSGPTQSELNEAMARAAGGDIEEQYRAGELCLEGCSPEGNFICDEELVYDVQQVVHHFRLAAMRGHVRATTRLLRMHYGEIGVMRQSKWGGEVLAAFELFEALGNAGNPEPRRIIDGVFLSVNYDPRVDARAKARLEELAAQGSVPAMRALARRAWKISIPDRRPAMACLGRAAQAGCSEAVVLASAIVVAGELLGSFTEQENYAIELLLYSGPPDDGPTWDSPSSDSSVGQLILTIACDRLESDGDAGAVLRRQILTAAVRHGSAKAAALLWLMDFEAAPDKPEFLRSRLRPDDPGPEIPGTRGSPDWGKFARVSNKLVAAYFGLAMSIEQGKGEAATHMAESAIWYWRGMLVDWKSSQAARWTAKQVQALDGDFCYHVARRLDPRVYELNKDPARAVRWYVLGLERGDATCLGVWVNASLRRALGLAPDPQSALEMADRWIAARPPSSAEGCWREILTHAKALASGEKPDAAEAAKWRRVAERLGGPAA